MLVCFRHVTADTVCLCAADIPCYITADVPVSGILHQMRFAYLLQTYCTPVSGILRQTLLQTYLITADIPVCPDILHQIRFACVPQTYCFTSPVGVPVCPDILHQIRFACVPQTYCFTLQFVICLSRHITPDTICLCATDKLFYITVGVPVSGILHRMRFLVCCRRITSEGS